MYIDNKVVKIVVKLFSFILIFPFACNPEPEYLSNSENYFPLEKSAYRIYSVEEIKYIAGNKDPEVSKFEEKHIINNVAEENRGSSYRSTVEVWKRNIEASTWVFMEIYSIEKRPNELIVNKNNVPIVTMIFPIRVNSKWDGNVYNTQGVSEFKYESINDSAEGWDNVVKILQREKSTLIDYYYSVQYYAPEIGLIFEEDTVLEYCQEENCIGEKIIDSGYSYKRVLRDYGLN